MWGAVKLILKQTLAEGMPDTVCAVNFLFYATIVPKFMQRESAQIHYSREHNHPCVPSDCINIVLRIDFSYSI